MRAQDFTDRLAHQAVLEVERIKATLQPERTDGDRERAEYEALVGKFRKDKSPPLSAMPDHQLDGRLVYFMRQLGGEIDGRKVASFKLEIARTQAEIARRRSQTAQPAKPRAAGGEAEAKPRIVRAERRGRPRAASRNVTLRLPAMTNSQGHRQKKT